MNSYLKLINLKQIVIDFLAVLGGIWLLIEAISFFFPNSYLNQYGVVVLALSLVFTLVKNYPKKRYEFQVGKRDINIALVIGDIFEEENAIIIPVNNSFAMSLKGNVMKTNSIQRQTISRYFAGQPEKLKQSILAHIQENALYFKKQELRDEVYKHGTVAHIPVEGINLFFVVSAVKKENNRVFTSFTSLRKTLPIIWKYLTAEADKYDSISIPLIGTGQGRLSKPREDVFRMILDSAVVASEKSIFATTLNIYIRQEDIQKYNISVEKLVEYLKFRTEYTR